MVDTHGSGFPITILRYHASEKPAQRQGLERNRHFGIAVDDKELARSRLKQMGVEFIDSRFLDFLDPWGNRVEITAYGNIQFSKADHLLQGMGLGHLKNTDQALSELKAKGLAP